MPALKPENFILINEMYGDGIAVDVYNGDYSVVAARKNKEGVIWAEWCFPQKYEDGQHIPGNKAIQES